MNWVNKTTLNGETVSLVPMEKEHFAGLEDAGQDKRIWEFLPIDMTDAAKRLQAFNTALVKRETGAQAPFVIFHREHNRIIGSTRLMDIQPRHKKLEIGWTWLQPGYWATEVNFECKLLLLTFCFEELKAVRVQLKTDENNLRSRAAIAKIGAQYEGLLRNDMLRYNGTKRNTAYFSIIDSEWEAKKEKLKALYLAEKNRLVR